MTRTYSFPDLRDYQKVALGSIEDMMDAYVSIRRQRNTVSRSATASAMTVDSVRHQLADIIETVQLQGLNPSIMWVDEAGYSLPAPEVVFDDKNWPDARIEVWRKDIDKRDPRHPNPHAGRIIAYEIRGESMLQPEIHQGLHLAKMRARVLHEAAIKAAQAKMRAANPNFGRF